MGSGYETLKICNRFLRNERATLVYKIKLKMLCCTLADPTVANTTNSYNTRSHKFHGSPCRSGLCIMLGSYLHTHRDCEQGVKGLCAHNFVGWELRYAALQAWCKV